MSEEAAWSGLQRRKQRASETILAVLQQYKECDDCDEGSDRKGAIVDSGMMYSEGNFATK